MNSHCDTMDIAVTETRKGLAKVRAVRITLGFGSHSFHVDMDETLAREFLANFAPAIRAATGRDVADLLPVTSS